MEKPQKDKLKIVLICVKHACKANQLK